jgi:catechol 2,3-dioxygenase-like lactoylglutathione lyase family enzyme
MKITSLDHLVVTVKDIETTVRFYVDVLGMEDVRFGGGRRALGFGRQRINLHQAGSEIEPNALDASPGSADLCFLVEDQIEDVAAEIEAAGVPIELGPVDREGAAGPMRSVYLRDPDGNLVELAAPAVQGA